MYPTSLSWLVERERAATTEPRRVEQVAADAGLGDRTRIRDGRSGGRSGGGGVSRPREVAGRLLVDLGTRLAQPSEPRAAAG